MASNKAGAEKTGGILQTWEEFTNRYFPKKGLQGLLEEIQEQYSLESPWQYRIVADKNNELCGTIEFAKPHFMISSDPVEQLVAAYLEQQGYTRTEADTNTFQNSEGKTVFLLIYTGETSFSVSIMSRDNTVR